jgi:hypothetical protein
MAWSMNVGNHHLDRDRPRFVQEIATEGRFVLREALRLCPCNVFRSSNAAAHVDVTV